VSVGTDHDTAEFAVETIRRWWNTMGANAYPTASGPLITADGGGSNGSRTRLWKTELAALATGLGNLIDVTGPPPLRAPTDTERAGSPALARQLQWLNSSGELASPDEVDAEWDQIKQRTDQAKYGGGTFEPFHTPEISDAEIDRIVLDKLVEMESNLKGRPPFVDFDSFPEDAQLGLLSMSWGMGPCSTFRSFRRSSRPATGPVHPPSADSTPTSARSLFATTAISSVVRARKMSTHPGCSSPRTTRSLTVPPLWKAGLSASHGSGHISPFETSCSTFRRTTGSRMFRKPCTNDL